MLEVGLAEETNDVGGLDLLHLLKDCGETGLAGVTVFIGEAVNRTLEEQKEFRKVLLLLHDLFLFRVCLNRYFKIF